MVNKEHERQWYLTHTWRMTMEAAQWTVDYFCMIDHPQTRDYAQLYVAQCVLSGELPCKA